MDSLKWADQGLRFKCTGCGKCCTGADGYVFLSESDLSRLAHHFEMTKEAFCKKYTRIVDERLVLLDQPNSDCIFLKNKQCAVYKARPVQCQTFPWWVQNIRSPKAWAEAATHCEGINHPDAPLIQLAEIDKQTQKHSDNLFSLV